MPLFLWVLALSLREINILYVMYKTLKTPAVKCLENGNCHLYRKLFQANNIIIKWIPGPENGKNQEINYLIYINKYDPTHFVDKYTFQSIFRNP